MAVTHSHAPEKADSASIPVEATDFPAIEYHHGDDTGPEEKTNGLNGAEDKAGDFQHGVQAAEALTQLWGKKQLILAYVLIWFVCLLQALSNNIFKFLAPFVTSSFQMHSLTALSTVISSLVSGLVMLPFSKMLDVWGRAQGFMFMVASWTLGVVLMAVCENVQTYAAAQVFYQVGYVGVEYIIIIFITDTSSMRNRALMVALSASSNIAIVWAYAPATNDIIFNTGIKWGIGMWAIIMPIACSPLIALLWYYQRKAEKQGLVVRKSSNRTLSQSIFYYVRELDVIGLLLITTGLSFFLLGLSLSSRQAEQWKSPMIISFLVIGPLIVVAFCLYEIYLAPVNFIKWSILRDRTILCAFIVFSSVISATYCLIAYYVSAFLILWNMTIPTAMNVGNIQLVVASFSAIVAGAILRYYGRFKWVALCGGLPLIYLGAGLMVYFRDSTASVGHIAMCMVFLAFGLGMVGICQQIALMSASTHQQIASLIATADLVANIGMAVGTAISGAIWTSVFPKKLTLHLPEEYKHLAPSIYSSILSQMSYPKGSPIKNSIELAYSDSLRIMMITSLCLFTVTFGAAMCWRDIDARRLVKNRGLVV